MKKISARDILFLNYVLAKRKDLPTGVRDVSLLKAALLRPASQFNGKELYPGIHSKAAALSQFIVRGKPFLSLNTATGMAAGVFLLQKNGIKIEAAPEELARTAAGVKDGTVELFSLTRWLQEKSI